MKLTKLLIPVFAVVIISVTAITGLVSFMVKKEDTAALKEERAILTHELETFNNQLAALAEDNAEWDKAVENLYLSENLVWLRHTVASTIHGKNETEGIAVIRPDGTILYAEFENNYPAPDQLLSENLIVTINSPRPAQPLTAAVQGTGMFITENRIFGYAFHEISSDTTMDIEGVPSLGPRPILVFFRELNAQSITNLKLGNAIKNPRIQNDLPTVLPSVSIVGTNGPIAYLVWEPFKPGSDIVAAVGIPIFFLGLVIFISLIFFTRNAFTLIRELERANKSKSAFLASMSHEVRTPLNSIIGFTELLSLELFGKVEGEKNKEYLSLIKGSGEHLLAIINDILDISKLEAGKYDVLSEPIETDAQIRSCLKLLEPAALDKAITITSSCAPTKIITDARIFRQILINILSNAIKFTGKEGSIHISAKPVDDRFRIRVVDTGIGMSPEDLEKALVLFGQASGAQQQDIKGTGLGLPLVKRFMQLLDGEMDITSARNKGTTVSLCFPMKNKGKRL
ncbi:ATP-binding protein [Kordiimonas laminariae]|uniref:ATP-binding protein n=1 Tax=Kordiimonas laminariae TaxID=2917717 RepID=UPI001FF1352B|nr:ATP-binding protein [Kordiimonas laminariae]MCK0070029.1 ATP-binding protein [Kordiimonas laminariae]